MALSPGEMHNRIIENLPEKSGQPLSHWLGILDDVENDKAARMTFLKTECGLGHQTAVAVMREKSGDVPWASPDALETSLRAELTPECAELYDALRAHALSLDSVQVAPCKTYTGLKTSKQIAGLQPSKADGLIVGLALAPDVHPELAMAKSIGSARIVSKATAKVGAETLKELITMAAQKH